MKNNLAKECKDPGGLLDPKHNENWDEYRKRKAELYKPKAKPKLKWETSHPGQVVSADQLISPTPGLIAQMLGRPTTMRYTCATIYVDNCSGYTFMQLQYSTNAEETIKGKLTYESHASSCGVRICHYHCDNGIFK